MFTTAAACSPFATQTRQTEQKSQKRQSAYHLAAASAVLITCLHTKGEKTNPNSITNISRHHAICSVPLNSLPTHLSRYHSLSLGPTNHKLMPRCTNPLTPILVSFPIVILFSIFKEIPSG